MSFTDPTSSTATVSPGGTDSLGQSVPGTNYTSALSTSEDVTIVRALIGLAKTLAQILPLSTAATNNDYTLVYRLTVENFGTDAFSNLELYDDVVTQFGGLLPRNYNVWVDANTVTLTPAPTLTLNATYNGAATTNILAAGQTLAVGATKIAYISFDVTVDPSAIAPNNTLKTTA